MNTNLEKIFDLEPVNETVPAKRSMPQEDTKNPDIELAKNTQAKLIRVGEESLDHIMDFARASESPRAWEVVATLLKNTSEVAKSLAEISFKEEDQKSNKQTINNNISQTAVFVGNTNELQKMLRERKGKL